MADNGSIYMTINNKERDEEAIPIMENFLVKYPSDSKMRLLLAEGYIKTKQTSKHLNFFAQISKELLKRNNLDLEKQRLVLLALLHSEQYPLMFEKFHHFFEHAEKRDPLFSWFFEQLQNQGQDQLALENLKQHEPQYKEMQNYYQIKYDSESRLKQNEKSIETLQQWIKREPENPQVLKNLAYAYITAGNRDEASKTFRTVRRLSKAVPVLTSSTSLTEKQTSRSLQQDKNVCPLE